MLRENGPTAVANRLRPLVPAYEGGQKKRRYWSGYRDDCEAVIQLPYTGKMFGS
jgi:hypothetical protein